MVFFIRKSGDGADLIIETTAIDNGGDGVTSGITVTASIQRMSGSNFFWDSTAEAFDDVAEPTLDALTHQNNGLYAFTLVGGAELVRRAYRIHLIITGNAQVNTDATLSDEILTEASLGYTNGFVYFDSAASSSGTDLGTDGTIGKPVNSETDAITLASSVGKKVKIRGTWSHNPALVGFEFEGTDNSAIFEINGSNVMTDNKIRDIEVQVTVGGAMNSSSTGNIFDDSFINDSISFGGVCNRCRFVPLNTHIMIADGLILNECYVDGDGAPQFRTFSTGNLTLRNWSGDIIIRSTLAGATVDLHITSGFIDLQSSNTGGTIKLTGFGELQDNSAGSTIDKSQFQEIPIVIVGGDATLSKQNDIITDLDDLKGTGFIKDTDSNKNLSHIIGSKGTDNIHDDLVIVDGIADAIKLKTDNLPEPIQKNTTANNFTFGLVLTSDDVSPALSIMLVTAERSIDGGGFVSMDNPVTEISDGDYKIDLSADDTNGTFITYKFSASGTRTKKIRFKTAV